MILRLWLGDDKKYVSVSNDEQTEQTKRRGANLGCSVADHGRAHEGAGAHHQVHVHLRRGRREEKGVKEREGKIRKGKVR
jgi:hypothetical protein